MNTVVLEPHGFCAGVKHALALAVGSFSSGEDCVYCLHELVHNELVVNDLRQRGMVFVEAIDEVPEGATLLFSAHGVSPAVREQAAMRHLKVIDATCPFVEKVHRAARDFSSKGLPVIVIGNAGHAEVKGILGEISSPSYVVRDEGMNYSIELPPQGTVLGVVSQTTMNADDVRRTVDELRRNYEVETMAEVCNATKERQEAVKQFAEPGGNRVLLVLGSRQSANTRRLCEVAESAGIRALIAGDIAEVRSHLEELSRFSLVGITSGASTPESFMDEVMELLS